MEPIQIQVPDIADHNRNDGNAEWKSCCLVVDKFMMQFLAQVFVCVLVISFCMVQLFNKESCPDQQLYMSTLTLVLGVFVPAPRLH